VIFENKMLVDHLFEGFTDPYEYVENHNLHELLGVDLADYGDITVKKAKAPYLTVDPKLDEAFVPELDDLF